MKLELIKYIFKNVMLPMQTRCWDAVDCVTDVLAIIHSMYSEELVEQPWAGLIYIDGFGFVTFSKLPTVAKGTRPF